MDIFQKIFSALLDYFPHDITVSNKMNSIEFYQMQPWKLPHPYASFIVNSGKLGQLKSSHLPKMTPTIGTRPDSRILVSYSRNLTKRMVLSGILVKITSKYKETNLTITHCPHIKITVVQKLILNQTSWNSKHFPKVTQISLLFIIQAGLTNGT